MKTVSVAGKQANPASDMRVAPYFEFEDGKYIVRLARHVEEIEAALKLRFEVFNLELREGLDSSLQTGRDRDEFDATCHHLIVEEKSGARVVGTYRLRTLEMAQQVEGFYSAAEFDLNDLPKNVLSQAVELGRACIAGEHRNRQVLFLLWKGLAHYATARRKRFLFGCCSLTTQDESEGGQMLRHLRESGYMHSRFLVSVRPSYECAVNSTAIRTSVRVPRLFESYLSIGAKVCSPPAIDRRFKTIDFLVIFDIHQMDSKTRRLFL